MIYFWFLLGIDNNGMIRVLENINIYFLSKLLILYLYRNFNYRVMYYNIIIIGYNI